jgi:hypothetical protein
VTAVPGCAWEAIVHDSFGSVSTANTRGIGTGLVTFTVAVNKEIHSNAPFFVVGGSLTFQITQSGCPLAVSPRSFHVPAAAADYFVSVRITGPVACVWTDDSNDNNIVFIGNPETRSGSADVRLSVRQNQTGQVRSASANVAGQTVVVTQDP